MMTFLRRQSQTVLVIILGILGLSFLFYGNVGSLLTNNSGGRGSTDYGRIDGRDLSVAELYNAVRSSRNMFLLEGRAQDLSAPGMHERIAEDAWRQLLLLAEADKLHIEISEKELVDFIESRPIFQKDGVYSPEVYQTQLTNIQNGLHISPDAFENLMRDNLKSDAVSKALFSTIHLSAIDVTSQYDKYYGPVTVSVATLDPNSFAASAQPTPAEVEAEYKAHPENPAYRTKEKRKVDYVLLTLPPDQAKLTGKDKTAALETLGQKALDFAVAFQPDPSVAGTAAQSTPDFVQEAKKRGYTPVATDYFTVDAPPTGLPPSPSFNNAAFALTKDDPISKVVELDNGVAIIHLTEIQPTELRPLAEVQGDIAKQLQQGKMAQAAQTAAQSTEQALQAAMAKGTDFNTAAAALHLTVKTIPPFVPANVKPTDPMIADIAETTTRLNPGQVSAPVSAFDNSILFVHIDKRDKGDPTGFAAFEDRFRKAQEDQVRQVVYIDWANWRSHQPGTHKPADLDAYGSVE